MGNKYRRNIYKITQRIGRKLKISAQFGNLEVVTIHVKNVKRFQFKHDLAHLPKAIRKLFVHDYRGDKNPFDAPSVGQSEQTNHDGDPFRN